MNWTPASYVQATRRLRPEFVFEKHHRALFEATIGHLCKEAGDVEFYTTSSTEMSCETVSRSGKTFLIYDQSLGTAFTQLNRIWTASINAAEVREFALRHMAEYAQITGRPKLAHHLATVSSQLAKSLTRQPSDHFIRSAITSIQERYILFHEFWHISLARDDPDRKRDLIDTARVEFVYNYAVPKLKWIEQEVDAGRYSVERAQKILEMFNSWLSVHWLDDALVEECVCDNLALPLIYDQVKAMPGMSPWLHVLALLFTPYHQEILATLRNTVDRVDPNRAISEDWQHPWGIRQVFVEHELQKHFEEGLFGNSFDFVDTLGSYKHQYAVYILYPIRDLAAEIAGLDRSLWEALPDFALADRLNREIDELLGGGKFVERARVLGEDAFVFGLGDLDALNKANQIIGAVFEEETD